MRPRLLTVVAGLAALLGLVFAAVSTHDFMAHLDRQVHAVSCSFLPGLDNPDASGGSGCHVAMMSPYSSIFRAQIWGGIPVSLMGMAVFAFLLFWTVHVVLTRKQEDSRAMGFLALAYAVPVGASLLMGYLSFATLDAACKLCIGIYVASGLGFVAAVGAWLRARKREGAEGEQGGSTSFVALAGAAAAGVAFVVVPAAAYAVTAPEYENYIGSCGELPETEGANEVLVPVDSEGGGVEAVEVLDPLCPACRGFEYRFEASSVSNEIRRSVLLLPLDDECNWMIDDAIHPGACTVSEAVLCSNSPDAVIEWAFAEQERIIEAARQDREAAGRMVKQQFPELSECVGSAKARAKLNRAMRWAVDNQLPVVTPQFYVEDVKVCDSDTDLGLDYMLSHMVAREREGELGS